MLLAPLLEAPVAVQVHVAAVLPAAVLGAFILLWRRKGTPAHRLLGKIWLLLMLVTAGSSFFIHDLNVFWGFSPIHLLSIATIFGCVSAYRTARAGNIRGHITVVRQLYYGGIIIAGGFTLLPYRRMHDVIIAGSAPMQLVALSAIVILPLVLFYLLQNRRARSIS